jgi:hypothetical protein
MLGQKMFDVSVVGENYHDLIFSDPSLVVNFGQNEDLVDGFSLLSSSSSAVYGWGAARIELRNGLVGIAENNFNVDFEYSYLNRLSLEETLKLAVS